MLYLLHAIGETNAWLLQQKIYHNLPAIVVIPGGGGNSGYTNWWSGGKRNPAWEKFFFNELMPKVNKSFPICPGRNEHAIAGSSMGGFGAMYFASQRPDYFGTAASFSGVIDLNDPVMQRGYPEYASIWGPVGGFYEIGHDPSYLLPNLAHTRLFVDVGNGVPLVKGEDPTGSKTGVELVMQNQASLFLQAAKRDHVPVTFDEHQGIHSQDNWDVDLDLLEKANPFGVVPTDPTTWQYTTVAQSGEAWGYRYSFAKPPATLERITSTDGVIRGVGSGKLSIISPTGQRFNATMPFIIKNGVLSKGSGSVGTGRQPQAAKVSVKVASTAIGRRSSIVGSFRAHKLLAGQAYQVGALEQATGCQAESGYRIPPVAAGHLVNFKIRPGTGKGHPRNQWCTGTIHFAVSVVDTSIKTLQIGQLVFVGKVVAS